MRLRAKAPFFAVLAMHAEYVADDRVETASTDGRNIHFNPRYVAGLDQEEVVGLVLHEVLHCAFVHVARRGQREPVRWNMAADYVINPMVMELKDVRLPPGRLFDWRYKDMRVEEVYELLAGTERELPTAWRDLRPELDAGEGSQDDGLQDDGVGIARGDGPHQRRRELEGYWRAAVNGAVMAHRHGSAPGALPAGARLLVEELNEPQVDWRRLLWEYTVEHPFDFGEYDLRHVGRGVYEEQLEGQGLELHVALDTSGSCVAWVEEFMSELKGMLGAFPHVTAHVYYADVALVGPFTVERFAEVPAPVGGGGTSFVPFFEHVARQAQPFGNHVLVYLTDGYGTFPAAPPAAETVWVVPPGGLTSGGFPFGRVIRLERRR